MHDDPVEPVISLGDEFLIENHKYKVVAISPEHDTVTIRNVITYIEYCVFPVQLRFLREPTDHAALAARRLTVS